MSATKTAAKATTKQGKPEKHEPKQAIDVKPILGVNLKGELCDIELARIVDPNGVPDRMPRAGDDIAIEQLAKSMHECGQLQPVMLEELADGRFCRVFGRRRIAAARKCGWTTIRASVVPPLPDEVRRTVVAIENVQRQDLTPAEETLAVDELMQLQAVSAAIQLGKPLIEVAGIYANRIVTAEDRVKLSRMGAEAQAGARHDILHDHRVRNIAAELVAAMLGKPATWVRDRFYIGRLSDKAKTLVRDGLLPLAHAREISKLADPTLRDRLAKDYAAGGSDSIGDSEAGPLEDLQEEVRKTVFTLHVVPWKLDHDVAGRRKCDGCPYNSLTNPGLFEHGGEVSTTMIAGRGNYDTAQASAAKVQEAGVCTYPACYADKLRATKAAIGAAAKRIVDGNKKASEAKVPAFVDPDALNRKVKARRDLAKHRKSNTVNKTRSNVDNEAIRKAENQASQEYTALCKKLIDPVNAPLQEYFTKNPQKVLIWELLKELAPIRDCDQWSDSGRAKALAKHSVGETLKILALPIDKAIEQIATLRFNKTGVGKMDVLDIDHEEARYVIATKLLKIHGMPVPSETLPSRKKWEAARVKEILNPKPKDEKAAMAPKSKEKLTGIPARKSSVNRATRAAKRKADNDEDEQQMGAGDVARAVEDDGGDE